MPASIRLYYFPSAFIGLYQFLLASISFYEFLSVVQKPNNAWYVLLFTSFIASLTFFFSIFLLSFLSSFHCLLSSILFGEPHTFFLLIYLSPFFLSVLMIPFPPSFLPSFHFCHLLTVLLHFSPFCFLHYFPLRSVHPSILFLFPSLLFSCLPSFVAKVSFQIV